MMTRRALIPPSAALSKALGRMAPGGLLWSESPIESFDRTVREAGVEAVEPPCGTEFPRTAMTATTATFGVGDGSFGFTALAIWVTWSTTHVGTISMRVADITPEPSDPPTDYTPTAWATVTGPGSGLKKLFGVAGGGQITAWVVEWDTPGVFGDDLCAIAVNME